MLVVCAECARHVKSTATSCPFCAAEMGTAPTPTNLGRVSRAAMFASASAIAVVACGQPMYGACTPTNFVALTSPCGFSSVTSDCGHATVTCTTDSTDDTRCSVSPIEANCTVTAVLGDGTTQQVHVTVGPNNGAFCRDQTGVVATDNGPDFTSLTCQPPPPHFSDAATD